MTYAAELSRRIKKKKKKTRQLPIRLRLTTISQSHVVSLQKIYVHDIIMRVQCVHRDRKHDRFGPGYDTIITRLQRKIINGLKFPALLP